MLSRHDQTPVKKFVKIKPRASIYDGNLVYFAKRMSYHNPRIARLRNKLKRQHYECALCKRVLRPDDIIELHHVLGEDGQRTGALEFLHGHCHDQVHDSKKVN